MRVEYSGKKMIRMRTKPSFIDRRIAFAVDSRKNDEPIEWIDCRELFSNYFSSMTEGFYFSHSPECGINIANFIRKTEDILGLSEFSLFYATNFNFATWITPSDFWRINAIRRSFITILIRCGISYDGNYEKALYSHNYTNRTKSAVKRFLYGFTELSDINNKGWVENFKNCNDEDIKYKLVMPYTKNRVDGNVIGINALWS